ncbi:hypothetical protein WA026_023486 [Henosepilachna vigintioctopunctata]|uniref:Zinc finger PHD-type domain-containing protein n=1 Tax=Henosepilachna vigintioctopunctata TaxID=420089 RepID=A0AAW1UXP1_9CUCU
MVVRSLKCSSCDSEYHPSCSMRVEGVKIISDTTMVCCGNRKESGGLLQVENGDNEISVVENKICVNSETKQQELLIKILAELEDKFDQSNGNNALLRFKISTLENEIAYRDKKIQQLEQRMNMLKKLMNQVQTTSGVIQ